MISLFHEIIFYLLIMLKIYVKVDSIVFICILAIPKTSKPEN